MQMGIKKDCKASTWTVSYSKRPGPKMMPISKTVRGIKSEKEAFQIYKKLVSEIIEKTKRKISPIWPEVVDKYAEYSLQRGISAKTIESHLYAFRAHTFEFWQNHTIDQISTKDIFEVFNLKLKESSIGNQQYVLRAIGRVFEFALDQGWIHRNPTPKIHFRKTQKLMGVLTKEQVERFLTQAKLTNHYWYPHWALALYTGMRNGELYALTWDKVDLENNLIKVDTAWNSKDGFKSTKSGHDRILEIAPDLRVILLSLKMAKGGLNFVLPRSNKWDKGEQARELRMFLVGLGLPEIRFHDLRATWATLLLSKGVEPIKVMKMGGWQDLKTMQIYVRKAGIDIRGCMDDFSLHNPSQDAGTVLSFKLSSF